MSTSSANINNSFFNGVYKEIWRKLIPNGLTEAEVDFIQELGGLSNGSRVLDLMCGYGRHSLELARRGIIVTAIDNSEDYIEEVHQKAKVEKLPIEAICSDILDANIEGQYDVIICMGNSFAFFNEEEVLLALKKVSPYLKNGGSLIINTWMIAEIAIRYFKETDWYYVGENKYLLENTYYLNPSRIETDHIIIDANGNSNTIKGIDYIFTISELQKIFQVSGLNLKDVYSTPRKRKFNLGDNKAYLVVNKF